MAQLTNFPFVNQLNTPTFDGRVDVNKWENCTIASLLSIILYYHPDYRGKISDDLIKTAVYGPNYTGPTDITRFLAYAGTHGVSFSRVTGTNAELVQAAHRAIQSGHPAIGTEVDPYVDTSLPQYAGWLHAFTFYADAPDSLTIMDPFGGKLVEKSDSEWEQVLRTGAIWVAANAAPIVSKQPVALSLSAHLKEAGWSDDGAVLVAPDKKFRVVMGFRETILKAGEAWDSQNWPLENEHGMTQLEDSHPEIGAGNQQLFTLGGLNWNQKYGVHPLAAGAEIQVLRAQVAKLYKALDTAKSDIDMLFALARQQGIVFEENK